MIEHYGSVRVVDVKPTASSMVLDLEILQNTSAPSVAAVRVANELI